MFGRRGQTLRRCSWYSASGSGLEISWGTWRPLALRRRGRVESSHRQCYLPYLWSASGCADPHCFCCDGDGGQVSERRNVRIGKRTTFLVGLEKIHRPRSGLDRVQLECLGLVLHHIVLCPIKSKEKSQCSGQGHKRCGWRRGEFPRRSVRKKGTN